MATVLLWLPSAGLGQTLRFDRLSLEEGEPPGGQGQTLRFDRLSLEDGLSQSAVSGMVQDRQGFLWLATLDGLNRYDGYDFKVYRNDPDNPHSLSDNSIRSLAGSRSNVLWVGTTGGGLDRFDLQTERSTHYRHDPQDPRSLSHNTVWAIHEDRSGAPWVGTSGGLNRLDSPGQFTRYPEAPNGPGRDVRAIHEDRTGILWIGYRHGATGPRSLSSDRIWAIEGGRGGTLWVGSGGGGLNRFDPETERFTRYTRDAANPGGLSSGIILSLREDRTGTLWIGTDGGGLNRLDPATESFRAYRRKDGLPNDTVYGIVEDDQHHLWLSTNHGLARFDPRAETFRNYDASHGLLGNEFNSGARRRSVAGHSPRAASGGARGRAHPGGG